VAGPFTVESLSPTGAWRERKRRVDRQCEGSRGEYGAKHLFPDDTGEPQTAGVQQAHKEDRITFTALTPWAGDLVCPKAVTGKARPRSAPPYSLVQNSAPSSALTSSPLLAKLAMLGSMCYRLRFNYEAHTTDLASWGAFPC